MNTRTEHDLLGSLEVPDHAYWGIHTARAVDNFRLSDRKISDLPELIRGMVAVKQAAARANGELGVLPEAVSHAIDAACTAVLSDGRCLDQFPTDLYQGGAGTSVNMNTNEVIANLALEHIGEDKGRYDLINPTDHVNAGQSTNDAYPTGLRLGLYRRMEQLLPPLAKLQQALSAKADEFADVLKMGRTQLQDAVPMTLGQEFAAFADLIAAEIRALPQDFAPLLTINLGGTAIGTGVNAAQGYPERVLSHLRQISGLNLRTAPDLIAATSDCGDYLTAHAALKRLAVKISKICNDLRLLSSGPRAGLNEIRLPERQAGSSIMPAKINPVIPEAANQACFKVFGNDSTILFAAQAGQLQLNVMEPVIVQALFESLALLANTCTMLADKCINGITANRETCAAYVLNSIGIVTYLTPQIGHSNGDKIGQICAQTGKSVREAALELGLLDEAQLDELLSPHKLLHPQR